MSRPLHTFSAAIACAVLLCCANSASRAGESVLPDESSLHSRIDALVKQRDVGLVADRCDDATFLRRVTLALVGRIPTTDEVRSFLESTSADKRQAKIDELLKSDDFNRHMAVTFELILMERRGGSHVKTSDFRGYLEGAFRANRSYLDIVCEVLSADGTTEKNRAASAFYLQRDVESHLLTRDTGRILFGMDMQCAQCHDHPLIDDYRQDDYYGLNAFFIRSELFQPDKKKSALIAEKAAGEATFKSVFTDREGNLRPRIPGGVELSETKLKPHERYEVLPAKNVRPVPVESRLSKLAETLRSTPSVQFDRNIVNRMWAHMFGRGLVHPVDLHHSANPPTHPEVLELLAQQFRSHQHDVRWLLREIALTNTWQRSFRLPADSPETSDAQQLADAARKLSESQEEESWKFDEQYESLLEQVDKLVADSKPVFDAELAAMKKIDAAFKPQAAAKTTFNAAKSKAETSQKLLAALKESSKRITAAAKLLADDSLQANAALLASRASKEEAALPKLKSAMDAEQKKLAAADAKLAEAEKQADPAIAATLPVDTEIRRLRREAYAKRLQAQSLRTQSAANRERADELQMIADLTASIAKLEGLTLQIAGGQNRMEELSREVKLADEQLAAAKAHYDQMAAMAGGMRKQAESSKTLLVKFRTQQQKVAEAAEKVSEVASTLPELTETGEALTALQDVVAAASEKISQQEQVVADAMQQLSSAQASAKSAEAAMQKTQQQSSNLSSQLQEAQKTVTALKQQLARVQADRATRESEVYDEALNHYAAARLTALTPEQLAWSILTATGQFDRQVAASAAKLEKAKPLTDAEKKDPAAVEKRRAEAIAAARKALEGTVNKFASLYAASAGQPQDDFFATAEQSLFLANGGEIRSWLSPAAGNLADRLNKLEEPAAAAEELYLSILSRRPSAAESADVVKVLNSDDVKKTVAVQEIVWALLTSAEFRFQH